MASENGQSVLKIGAIGDSLTTGFNSENLGNRRDLSWSTGISEDDKVKSHAFFLSHLYDIDVAVKNVAVAGAKSNALASQLKTVLAFNPDYVTILIGANDACTWNENDSDRGRIAFYQDVDKTIEALIDKNPRIKILLSAVPNLQRLRDLGLKNGCQKKWDFYGICKRYLGKNSTESTRSLVIENLAHINQALRDVSIKWADYVAFSSEINEFEFEFHDISTIDCFHPSISGQNRISEVSFQSYLQHFEN